MGNITYRLKSGVHRVTRIVTRPRQRVGVRKTRVHTTRTRRTTPTLLSRFRVGGRGRTGASSLAKVVATHLTTHRRHHRRFMRVGRRHI